LRCIVSYYSTLCYQAFRALIPLLSFGKDEFIKETKFKKMYLLPLVSTLLSGVFSGSVLARYYGHRGSGIINVFCLFVAFVSSSIMYYEVVFGSCEVFIDLFGPWFTVGSFNVY
jgi:hypothetical protein